MTSRYFFSASTSDIDRQKVYEWICGQSYWGSGRPHAVQDAAIQGSRNYGVFDRETGAQVAYARVVTDGATFAWLCDVFVDQRVRGAGIGSILLPGVRADLEGLGIKKVLLATKDAHAFYEKFGFAALKEPEKWMLAQLSPQT